MLIGSSHLDVYLLLSIDIALHFQSYLRSGSGGLIGFFLYWATSFPNVTSLNSIGERVQFQPIEKQFAVQFQYCCLQIDLLRENGSFSFRPISHCPHFPYFFFFFAFSLSSQELQTKTLGKGQSLSTLQLLNDTIEGH